MKKSLSFGLLMLAILFSTGIFAQKKSGEKLSSEILSELKFRSIGPAFMSGRIADIAINSNNENQWYVAVGSGGVWKTNNSGTTWESIFDDQVSYSIGCLTIDPNNDQSIWVGTGENVGGRHVGFGDGVYKSLNGGKSWENMGLKSSEHISKIVVDPNNSNIVYVASQGPLWSKGGERGFYKSTDGGKSWKNTLRPNDWTGVTDIVVDPKSPNIIYAATWQRHRNVAALMGGGPESSIYKSSDFGETWKKIDKGISSSDKGKIGIAISPQKSNVLYAAVELERRKGAVYRSENFGESWQMQSETVSGGTGPHYYQELYADPFEFDKIYLMDVRTQLSTNGGKSFETLKESYKHSDNHAIAFKMSDPKYLLLGTDGGLYESFDQSENWKYISNLPVTQFYKIAVDDSEPFYNIYGGTQDNSTQVGPSRTDNLSGIVNADWNITLFADGHQPATEPGNPNIAYSEWQEGNLMRVDRSTGELVYIKPQPEKGAKAERFNWDAPIWVSSHDPKRIYYASHRLWRSHDRGDSWKAISGDLTNNEDRFKIPLMEKTWGWDAAWDVYAMSNYSTITSISESEVNENYLAIGTDDGLIQISKNGGETWDKIPVSKLGDCPEKAFVNDIRFDLYDQNTLYVALDNHKNGDFKPYFYKSENAGKSWSKISNGLGDRNLVWRFVQDHKNKNLMFLACEFGAFVSVDGARNWIKLTGGLPNISFRDIKIQKRENDLVLASFGRGIYILDDYSALREFDENVMMEKARIFEPREALWYIPRPSVSFGAKGEQGAGFYNADNPEFGVTFTYYIKESESTLKAKRVKKEKEDQKANKAIEMPEWSEIDRELNEITPNLWLFIYDQNDTLIRKLEVKNKKGLNRFTWDMSFASSSPVLSDQVRTRRGGRSSNAMVEPGSYYAQLFSDNQGKTEALSNKTPFKIKKLRSNILQQVSDKEVVDFWKKIDKLKSSYRLLDFDLEKLSEDFKKIQIAYKKSAVNDNDINQLIYQLENKLNELDIFLNGSKARREIMYNDKVSIGDRISFIDTGISNSTYGPTASQLESYQIVLEEMDHMSKLIENIANLDLKKLKELIDKGDIPKVK